MMSIQLVDSVPSTQNTTPSILRLQRSFLRTEGRWIVDEAENIVVLRGVNFYGYEYGRWNIHNEDDYRKIASWGFNVVRLPLAWNFIEPAEGVYDESYFLKHVDRDVSWARKYGLFIILDMHEYGWSPYFTYHDPVAAGVPSWGVSAYPNDANGEARAAADFWSNLGPNGSPVSSSNPSMIDRFIQMWKYVATRYRDENTIAAYDLFNEPNAEGFGSVVFYDLNKLRYETLPNFYTKVVDAVRTIDPNHMILWEPMIPDASDYRFNAAPVRRPNVVYSPHYPGSTGILRYHGYKTLLDTAMKTILESSKAMDQPVFIGEWGIVAETTNASKYVRDVADLLDKYLMGSAYWTYGRAAFGMALIDKNGNERNVLVENLVRPFVRLASNVQFSGSYESVERVFRIDSKQNLLAVRLPLQFSSFWVDVYGGAVSVTWTKDARVILLSIIRASDMATLIVHVVS